MTPRTQSWLGIALAALLLAALAWSSISSGTQTCMRCGTVDEQVRVGSIVWTSRERPSAGTAWFESVCGACARHEWLRTGCWRENGLLGGKVSCSAFPPRHDFNAVCSTLADQDLARAVARHFAAQPAAHRFETFRTAYGAITFRAERDIALLSSDLRVWSTGPVYTPLVFTR